MDALGLDVLGHGMRLFEAVRVQFESLEFQLQQTPQLRFLQDVLGLWITIFCLLVVMNCGTFCNLKSKHMGGRSLARAKMPNVFVSGGGPQHSVKHTGHYFFMFILEAKSGGSTKAG